MLLIATRGVRGRDSPSPEARGDTLEHGRRPHGAASHTHQKFALCLRLHAVANFFLCCVEASTSQQASITRLTRKMSALRGQDAWRRHPIFKWGFTDALPGLREGAAAFGLYMAAEYAMKKFGPAEEGHGHGHGAHGHAAPAPGTVTTHAAGH